MSTTEIAKFSDGLIYQEASTPAQEGPFQVTIHEWVVVGPVGGIRLTAMRNLPLDMGMAVKDALGVPWLAMDLGYHYRWPQKGIELMRFDYCTLFQGEPCYYDGGVMSAFRLMRVWSAMSAMDVSTIPELLAAHYWREMP